MPAEVLNPALEGLTERLAHNKACFDSLVELIPPKYYLTQDNDQEPTGKYAYNKKNKAPKQAIKEATKKAKKAKLDPENYKSVLDLQSEAAEAEKKKKESQNEGGDDEGDEDEGDDDDVADEMEVDDEDEPSVQPMPTGSITELRAKIQNRLAELAAKRGGAGKEGKPGETTPRSRQEILDRRAKRKAEKKAAIAKKKDKKKKGDDTAGMSVPAKAKEGRNDGKPVADAVSFGKLDFGVPESGSKKRKADLAGQLKQAEAKKAKLETLSKTAPEKAAAIAEKQAWNKLEQLAEGEKVKDDVKLLKKTVKRKEQEKAKSAQTWNDRQAQVKKEQEQKQKKREENIKARLEARNAPKGKKGKKPAGGGKKRPGFEGSMGKRSAGGAK
ncbi:surfeit locus protein [Rhizophlyctis rosea]|nr:surfeit locus protein [Rhizophlyctis rosea]